MFEVLFVNVYHMIVFKHDLFWCACVRPVACTGLDLCLVTESCLTLYDPMDCSLPGSSVLGILQAGILEWVAISFSKAFISMRSTLIV